MHTLIKIFRKLWNKKNQWKFFSSMWKLFLPDLCPHTTKPCFPKYFMKLEKNIGNKHLEKFSDCVIKLKTKLYKVIYMCIYTFTHVCVHTHKNKYMYLCIHNTYKYIVYTKCVYTYIKYVYIYTVSSITWSSNASLKVISSWPAGPTWLISKSQPSSPMKTSQSAKFQ